MTNGLVTAVHTLVKNDNMLRGVLHLCVGCPRTDSRKLFLMASPLIRAAEISAKFGMTYLIVITVLTAMTLIQVMTVMTVMTVTTVMAVMTVMTSVTVMTVMTVLSVMTVMTVWTVITVITVMLVMTIMTVMKAITIFICGPLIDHKSMNNS